MTDARLPEKWLNDRRLHRLSDADFRAFINALLWCVTNRTDGLIEPADLNLIPNMTNDAPVAFVAAKLWTVGESGWRIADFQTTQTSRSEHEALERARKSEREKKARWRAKQAEEENRTSEPCPVDSPVDGPVDMSRGLHRKEGQEGKDRKKNGSTREIDDDYTADLQEWCAEDDATSRRIEANIRAGYES